MDPNSAPNPSAPHHRPGTPPPSSGRPRGAAIAVAALGVAALAALLVVLFTHQLGNTPGSSNALNGTAHGTNNPQSTGCPGSAAAVTWPQAALVTIQAQDANRVTSAHTGDSIAVTLPSGYVWTLLDVAPPDVHLLSPAGYYDAPSQSCNWRFHATSPGSTQLRFQRQMLCQPGQLCSDLRINYTFLVQIS